MTIKQHLYNQCYEFIENRLGTIKKTIQDIQKALLSETKSSVGDKHETGRAMLQLEREKAGHQLAEIDKIKGMLSKISLGKSSETIGLGSVVYTTQHHYFIAVSAGKLKVENELFYAVSPSTPIGKVLMGKTVGDELVFNGLTFRILKVY